MPRRCVASASDPAVRSRHGPSFHPKAARGMSNGPNFLKAVQKGVKGSPVWGRSASRLNMRIFEHGSL